MTRTVPAIRTDGLRKAFDGEPVVDGVDLTLPPGEVTLLMGPNGEGKTVLLCCLAGGLRPTAGQVLVHGRPATASSAHLSLLLQGAMGLPALTGPETARFYADLHPASTGRWRQLLDRFEVTDGGTILKHCSGGTRRKVELAAALDPAVSVFLLDEPTAGLDLAALHTLHQLLRERRAAGRTVVLTSHSPLDVELADRLVFLDEGSVVAHDTPGALLASVPPVVRLRGAIHDAVRHIQPYLRHGHSYGNGSELRGLLRPDGSLASVRSAVTDLEVSVELDEPTPVDLYEHLAAGDPGGR